MAIKVELMKEKIVMENILRTDKLTSKETNFIIGISFILALRQFGMMLVVPFISKYGLKVLLLLTMPKAFIFLFWREPFREVAQSIRSLYPG